MQLSGLSESDLSLVLSSLTAGQRRRVEQLIEEREPSAGSRSGARHLSPMIRERLERDPGPITPHARSVLQDCAAQLLGPPEAGQSLTGRLRELFGR